MDLIIVRHADAHPLGVGGTTTDEARPLTDHGHRQARSLAVALKARGVAPAVVAPSPLVRARETAAPLLALLPAGGEPTVCEALDPDRYRAKDVAEFVAGFTERPGAVVLVGHNPSISEFARWLVNGERGSVEMDKGAAILIECHRPEKGGGVLRWFVTPDWYL